MISLTSLAKHNVGMLHVRMSFAEIDLCSRFDFSGCCLLALGNFVERGMCVVCHLRQFARRFEFS